MYAINKSYHTTCAITKILYVLFLAFNMFKTIKQPTNCKIKSGENFMGAGKWWRIKVSSTMVMRIPMMKCREASLLLPHTFLWNCRPVTHFPHHFNTHWICTVDLTYVVIGELFGFEPNPNPRKKKNESESNPRFSTFVKIFKSIIIFLQHFKNVIILAAAFALRRKTILEHSRQPKQV